MAISFVADATTADQSADSSTVVVNLPAGTQAGDLVLIQIFEDNTVGATNNSAIATGWTQLARIRSGTTGSRFQFVFYRILDGSEGSTVTFTWSGTNAAHNQAGARAVAYRGTDSPPTDGTVTTSSTNSSPTSCGAVTTTVDNDLMLFFAVEWNANSTFTVSTPAAGASQRYLQQGSFIGAGVPYTMVLNEFPAASAGAYSAAGSFSGAASQQCGVLIAIKPGVVASLVVETRRVVRNHLLRR